MKTAVKIAVEVQLKNFMVKFVRASTFLILADFLFKKIDILHLSMNWSILRTRV